MLYLINALGGFGRSVTETARLALTQGSAASRWRKFALYAAMFALPGGSLAVIAMVWAQRRRAKKAADAVAPVVAAQLPAPAAPVQQACGGAHQPACRAACAGKTATQSAAQSAAHSAALITHPATPGRPASGGKSSASGAWRALGALPAIGKTAAVHTLGRALPNRRQRRNDA
ncbi:hypothetical protein [Paraburkholderia sp. J41]|uniref:hypothetical protein n=1 Tax=Paraburkholderia sp. J41 TaxID=2805433 RepID=UPI002AC320A3|nr:hypothetical protein [Paraburkholderia sp. J41]